MKLYKRILSVALSAALTAGVFGSFNFSASAKEKSSVIFDFNGDNVSDEKDIEGVVELNNKYHAPVLQEMIYGDLGDVDYDTTQADGISRYFLTNLNQCTTPRLQKPLGDCWAQVAAGMLESSALKAKARLKNPDGRIDSKAFSEPVLKGLTNKALYSPRAVAWFYGEAVGKGESTSQAGEGCVFPDNSNNRFTEGGFMSFSETLFTAWRGVFKEEQYPHVPNDWDGTMGYITEPNSWNLPDNLSAKSFDRAPRVTDSLLLPDTSEYNKNEKTGAREWKKSNKKARSIIKQALIDYGAVHMGYNSSGDDYSSTVYTDKSSSGSGHAALIVGWDDNFSKDNYVGKNKTAPPENGAWLVKNTFGSYEYMKSHLKNWDVDREGIMGMTYEETQAYYKEKNTSLEQMKKLNPNIQNKYAYEFGIRDSEDRGTGFFWVYYCDRSLSGHAVYNVDIPDDGYDYDNNYQYDYAVSQDDIRLSLRTADTGTLVSNVFTSNGKEKLKAFSAYTNASDCAVKTDIYLLNGSESNPTQGELVYTTEDKIKLAGFHTIKLKKEIDLEKGQKFAIVQNTKSYNKSTDSEVSYLNLETVFDSDKISMTSAENKVVCNDGETFVRLDGKWTTPKQLKSDLAVGQIATFGNAKIKAFTVNEVREPVVTEPEDEKTEYKDVSEVVPEGTKTKTIRFYMRDDWRDENSELYDGNDLSSCKPGIYWWKGSYNCNEVYGSNYSWPGYKITKTDEGDGHIYIAEIPEDVEDIIINNMVKLNDESLKENPDLKYHAAQTQNISMLGYDKGDSPYDLYPEGLDSVDGMIYVSGRSDTTAEYSGVENEGAWYYYYGNGKYGAYKTLAEAEKNNAVYSDGKFPTEKKSAPVLKLTSKKKSNPIKVTAKKKSIKAKKLKKKAQKVKALTVKSAKGRVAYGLVKKGSSAKLFKKAVISAKGVVTIKKTNLKKGLYKLKTVVTASGDANYNSAKKTVVISIRVK